ncbi:DMT family transporter [Moorena producens JHB]|uniref:DMT family transporter n=1 Tax=Moorena producens (strain JHB) TaxID=1454205 RepID=A0A1D9G2J4_MOOP1|nr:DMT family transporter [Moorena producens]AOY81833.1 DMT family transporter [Moorena producens JHB]
MVSPKQTSAADQAIPHQLTRSHKSRVKIPNKISIGVLLALLSCLMLSFQYIIIYVIFNQSWLFGLQNVEVGGLMAPGLGNSLLIMWLKMLVVVPLMAFVARLLYPSVWRDIRRCAHSGDLPLFSQMVASSFFLFLSQVLIYLSLGLIQPGVAITIFFIYPIVTVILTGLLFGNRTHLFTSDLYRPHLVRGLVMVGVVGGALLISLPSLAAKQPSSELGVIAAAGAGLSFAVYIIMTQVSARKLNPIPYSFINFTLILVFSSLTLSFPLDQSWRFFVEPSHRLAVYFSCLGLGLITLVSYLVQNFAIRLIGGRPASIIGSTAPVLTTVLAVGIIQQGLGLQEIIGLFLVTLGVVTLSMEKLRHQSWKRSQ